jgi:hypothetical protein
MSKINTKIKKLNKPRLGSFGEYLFVYCIKKKKKMHIEKKHSNHTDYVVNSRNVDVKTTRKNINKDAFPTPQYNGKRKKGIHYALVEFFANGARVKIEKSKVGLIGLNSLDKLFKKWASNHKIIVKTSKSRKDNAKLFRIIKDDITNFFKLRDMDCRIIYRTLEAEWGKESPDNLKPKNILKNRITVYISFNGQVDIKKILSIYAYTDEQSIALPMLPKKETHLHKPKVDLSRVPYKYKFKSIEELEEKSKQVFRSKI